MAARTATRYGSAGEPGSLVRAIGAAVAGAWVVAILFEVTGEGALLHHHALIEGGPPVWVAIPAFLGAWQVMVVGMMVPVSVPAIGAFESAARRFARPRAAVAGFLAAYALVWTVFGLLAFLGDVVLHQIVDAMPWLAARPWLVQAGVVGLAGAYQFAPFKQRGLDACRHPTAAASQLEGVLALPVGFVGRARRSRAGGFSVGLSHALDCLGSSWALMLLVFAAGFANLAWMVALTAVMAYEVLGRQGRRAARAVGAVLLGLAASALVFGSLPGWSG